MATLTQTSIIARKIIRYLFYGITTIIIGRFTYLIGARIYEAVFPEPPPPPEVCFGKMPLLPFPDRQVYEDITLILETPEGSLPELPLQTNVYFMPRPVSNIRALERARVTARRLGFDESERELSDTVYQFTKEGKPSELTMNIVTNVFSVSYDIEADERLILGNPPVPDAAINEAQGFINSGRLLAEDLKTGPTSHEFIRVRNGEFVGAISLSEADMVKVNLFRDSYDELPSLPPDPEEANVWLIVGAPRRRESDILAGEYHYFPIDTEQKCTYPMKTAEQAWEDLNSGGGFIASLGKNPENAEIKIRRVYLAYYDAGVYTQFFQPIVVFEGDSLFKAYVPAVSKDLYGAEATEDEDVENPQPQGE